MKKSLVVKTVAILLFVIAVLLTIAGFMIITLLYETDVYTYNKNALTEKVYKEFILEQDEQLLPEILTWYRVKNNSRDEVDEEILRAYENKYNLANTNYACIVRNLNGNIILQTAEFENYYFKNVQIKDYTGINGVTSRYILESYIVSPFSANNEFETPILFAGLLEENRYTIIVFSVLGVVITVFLFVFLMSSAGYRKGKEGVSENFIDKIPFDVFCVLIGIFMILVVILFEEMGYYSGISFFIKLVLAVLGLGIVIIPTILLVCMTFATRCKLGTVFSNMFIVQVCKHVIKGIKYLGRLIAIAFKNIDVLWKVGIVYAVMTLFELFMMLAGNSYYWSSSYFGFILLWLFAKLIIAGVLIIVLVNFKQVRIAAEKLAGGDINYKADTKYMQWDIKKHANTINSIGGGLSKAVDEKMKSERLKTELITNVSHDIKTPLTSIINYVDLLKKEELENEKAQEYLEVLDRQSHRLKKLTEDLVEASKASTGNISVDKQETELGMLLSQALGEYEERINAAGLTTVLRIPEEPITVMTDGRLLWRVFDNLLSNICKYSMPNTRVYIELQALSKEAVFVFRNISKYELNISSDELMERFVRGDSSRNTEGSGLGLSIAKSLVDLLGGEFSLSVDGDLFKVILQFPL